MNARHSIVGLACLVCFFANVDTVDAKAARRRARCELNIGCGNGGGYCCYTTSCQLPIDVCTTAFFPLCPKMARLSYATAEEGRDKLVGRFVAEEAKRRRVEIHPLSYFVAEFRGPRSEIEWFRTNYPVLLCAFNPDLVTEDESTFRSCMGHVHDWQTLIESGKAKELMDDRFLYCPNCCTAK